MCIFTNFGEQCPRAVRLCHIGVAAGGARPGLVAAQCIGGDDNDGDVVQHRIRLDTAGRLVAVKKRELNVHQDDIGTMRGSGSQRLLAVADLDDLESGVAQEIAEDPPISAWSSTTRMRFVMRSPLAVFEEERRASAELGVHPDSGGRRASFPAGDLSRQRMSSRRQPQRR
jgi:hypothetical protein